MRTKLISIVVGGSALLGLAGAGMVPRIAGAQVQENHITIVKVVDGVTPPAGTTFTVQLDCQPAGGGGRPTVTFDATGKPTSTATLPAGPGQTCVVTETDRGGARNLAYTCAVTPGDTDPNGTLATCTGTEGNTVHFGDVVGDSATITVTNSFGGPAPAGPVTEPIQATPVFTG
jgi:hypothetical protein